MPGPTPELEQKDIILQAGAGAGKTTALVEVFLNFAKKFQAAEGKLPRIVVTTFTRKATQELKERLLKKALEEKREDLFHFISTKSCVQISTIHGVLNLFLARYGAAMGLTPDYKIQTDSENRKALRRIVRKVILEKAEIAELLEEYDFKTLELYLLQYFQTAQIHPDLKFAPEEYFVAADEGVRADLKSRSQRIAAAILEETDNEGWQTYLESLATIDWNTLSAIQSFEDFAKKPAYRKATPPFDPSLNEELEKVRDDIEDYLKKPAFRPSFWKQHEKNAASFDLLAHEVTAIFEKQKLEQGLLSMGDLEIFAHRLIQAKPECARAFSLEWDFWMIDEYQDTSPLQVELMRSLIGERPSFIVGDPQQSIYLFRGARSEVFKEKIREVQESEGEYQEKRINYRSSPQVLSFINSYFSRLDSQFSEMEVDPRKEQDLREISPLQFWITDTSVNEEAESRSALARVQEILSEGVSPEKICILSRTHQRLEDTAGLAQRLGLPFQLHSASGFFERREVLDALQFLKFILNPHDNVNFVALLRSPWFYLRDQDILEFCHDQKKSFWRVAQDKAKGAGPIATLKSILGLGESLGIAWTLKKALMEFGYLDYSHQMDPSGRREANLWKIVDLLSQEERRPGFNFLDLIETGLETLSTEAESNDADATPVIEPKRINFMTVHASKGLQFDHIILLGVGQDMKARAEAQWRFDEETSLWTLPIRDEESQAMTQSLLAQTLIKRIQEREAQEFNRILYVALTRAKFGITLILDKKMGKKSWGAHCPFDLTEGEHEEKDFNYIVRCDEAAPSEVAEVKLSPKQIRPLWAEPQIGESKQTLSVTDLISSFAVANAPSQGAEALEALKQAQQGTEAHRFFEALKYTSVDSLKASLPAHLQGALSYLITQKEIPLMRIIEQGEVEWGFAARVDGSLIQGQIDLWGLDQGTLWVLDYKTGSQRYSETAFAQMEVYAWAILYTKQVPADVKVKLAVIYPLDQTIKVREPGGFADLEKKLKNYLSQKKD